MNVKYTIAKITKITIGIALIIFLLVCLKTFIRGSIDYEIFIRLLGSLVIIFPGSLIAAILLYLKDEKDKK